MSSEREQGPSTDGVRRAIVLAGGGVTGVAWHLGILAGLQQVGVDLVAGGDVVVGTSAGATVAAQVTSGVALKELLETQLRPDQNEIPVDYDATERDGLFHDLVEGAATAAEARARIGAMALAAATVPESTRLKVIAGRLPRHAWPTTPLRLTAVDALSGRSVVFDQSAGVELVDAVAASCAVPGVWPPVTIAGRRYVDGGVRSLTNADVAAPCDRVVVLIPVVFDAVQRRRLDRELSRLAGAAAVIVSADDDALAAIGPNLLDPTRRGIAATEGLRQAGQVASEVGAVWT